MEALDIDNPKTPAEGPGKLLTDARLKLGLEPQNVAEMLHLREYQIRALEADDYENLPEPTYVKGYLRAYCQLLSLDPDRVVKMYSDSIQPPVHESFEVLATEKQAASNDNLVKLVSIAMIALVAGLAATFWLTNREPDLSQPTQTSSVETPADSMAEIPTTVVDEANQVQEPLQESQPETETTSVPEAGPEKIVKPEAQNTVKREPDAPVVGSAESSTTPVPPVAVTKNPVIPPAAPPTSSEGLNAEPSLLPETDPSAHSRLLVKVLKESWVDVRDAKGNKLIYESIPAGREIPLEGLAPFSIFLGNASGVQVFLNGIQYDFSSYRRGLTARFKLAADAGAQ